MSQVRGLLICMTALLAACATPTVGVPATAPFGERDKAEMLAALDASARSWNTGDLKGHLAIYDESVTVMTEKGPQPTIAAIEDSFGKGYFQDGKPKQSLSTENVAIRSLSPDSALMTGRFILSGGGLPEQSGWFSRVWVREPAGWRVVHDHTG